MPYLECECLASLTTQLKNFAAFLSMPEATIGTETQLDDSEIQLDDSFHTHEFDDSETQLEPKSADLSACVRGFVFDVALASKKSSIST